MRKKLRDFSSAYPMKLFQRVMTASLEVERIEAGLPGLKID
tara:strand:+ start:2546 stop:2668 length:123 start_codon:yes stop_codon:yes gene_type:complete